MRVDKIRSPLLPKREYNAKREWLLPGNAGGVWRFYENGRIFNGTCRVAAYLNKAFELTVKSLALFHSSSIPR